MRTEQLFFNRSTVASVTDLGRLIVTDVASGVHVELDRLPNCSRKSLGEAVLRLIDTVEGKSTWISVHDRKPEKAGMVLVLAPSVINGKPMVLGFVYVPDVHTDKIFSKHYTHWMPLPSPPVDPADERFCWEYQFDHREFVGAKQANE